MRLGAIIKLPPMPVERKGQTILHQMFDLPELGLGKVVMHCGDHHDQLVALTRRTMLPVPLPDTKSPEWAMFHKLMLKTGRCLGTTRPWTRQKFVNHYSGRLRRRYEEAAHRVETEGLRADAHHISAMLKLEKWDVPTFLAKPGRTIQFARPEYNYVLGRHLKPIEERI